MEKEQKDQSLLHDFNQKKSSSSIFSAQTIAILLIVLLLGIGSGYLLSSKGAKSSLSGAKTSDEISKSSITKGTVVGSDDLKTFKDPAEGILKEGGTNGEGQFHLVRPGGDDQNVYVTSSLVDLSKFVDKKIKVWGQTQKAQVAGWLMDVGRVEVLE